LIEKLNKYNNYFEKIIVAFFELYVQNYIIYECFFLIVLVYDFAFMTL